jgi:hypothetical protein
MEIFGAEGEDCHASIIARGPDLHADDVCLRFARSPRGSVWPRAHRGPRWPRAHSVSRATKNCAPPKGFSRKIIPNTRQGQVFTFRGQKLAKDGLNLQPKFETQIVKFKKRLAENLFVIVGKW